MLSSTESNPNNDAALFKPDSCVSYLLQVGSVHTGRSCHFAVFALLTSNYPSTCGR